MKKQLCLIALEIILTALLISTLLWLRAEKVSATGKPIKSTHLAITSTQNEKVKESQKTGESPQSIIKRYARRYGVNPEIALFIARKESNFDPLRVGDNGESYGLFQIHLPDHRDITKEQAQDVDFAANWSMKQIVAGNIGIWSTWRMRALWYQDYP